MELLAEEMLKELRTPRPNDEPISDLLRGIASVLATEARQLVRSLHQLSAKLDQAAAAAPERDRHLAWAKADEVRWKLARFLLAPRRGPHRKPLRPALV